jgi:SAM-dependent methyltransferase
VPASATHPTQQALERTPCPSCGGARSSFVIAAPDRLASDDSRRFTVVRCLDCGLAYLSPRPTADEAGRYYPESYSGGDRGGLIERLDGAYRRRQHLEVARWLARRRPQRGRLLDVGCGSGDLLVALRADRWRAQGVEPQPQGAARARDAHGLDVLTGRFEDVELPASAFDAIVFSGVLEHLYDPVAALRRARRLLAPGGLVAVLFLPMLGSPEARLLGQRWMALDLPRHVTHFEDTTFTVLAAKAGLGVAGRETYSRRHNPAQLVGSVAPGLQKHRFYAAETAVAPTPSRRAAAVARRAAFLAALAAAAPATRLAAAAGAPSMCSYFLVPLDDAG